MQTTTSTHDLHTHSTASDGTLSPAGLVERAHALGVSVLALTDHDSLGGLEAAAASACTLGVDLVPGIELSVTWEKRLLHVVGLKIDPTHGPLIEGIARLAGIREARAEKMGAHLDKRGIPGAYAGARALAGGGMLTRTHFARYLAGQGHAPDVGAVFKHYLVRGKPGYVKTDWAALDEAVGWIRGAGGTAVLAHPLRYRMTRAWMDRTLAAFIEAGGTSIEVVYGSNTPQDNHAAATYARRFGLSGSVGSDFHSPDVPWTALGRLPALPGDITPVWQTW